MTIQLLTGDVRDVLPTLPDNSVQCVVTSPPYYGLRDYGVDGQLGLEPTPDAYLATMVQVFREVRRVLRPDGVCWVNMGDSYASGEVGRHDHKQAAGICNGNAAAGRGNIGNGMGAREQRALSTGLAPKQLLMMPARLALALQADGWWLRSDIIWSKPNPMPESVTDRPTSAHEHVFLLTKRSRYFYDADAVRERVGEETRRNTEFRGESTPYKNDQSFNNSASIKNYAPAGEPSLAGRSCRNVWTIATAPFPAAHFATFPPALAERCIRAGSKPGDTILDPFSGAGTALLVADRLGRSAIGIDLSHAYMDMARARLVDDCPLFADLSPPPANCDAAYDRDMRDLFAWAAD